jgi:hypothetical protein
VDPSRLVSSGDICAYGYILECGTVQSGTRSTFRESYCFNPEAGKVSRAGNKHKLEVSSASAACKVHGVTTHTAAVSVSTSYTYLLRHTK